MVLLIKGAENGAQCNALEYSPRHHARLALAALGELDAKLAGV